MPTIKFILTLLLAVFISFYSLSVYCQQPDSGMPYRDSIRLQVERAAQNYQDSLAYLRLQKNLKENGKSLDEALAEYKEQESKEKRKMYIRIGVGALFLIALFYGIARRSKQRR